MKAVPAHIRPPAGVCDASAERACKEAREGNAGRHMATMRGGHPNIYPKGGGRPNMYIYLPDLSPNSPQPLPGLFPLSDLLPRESF